jgi:hypothetical protein
MPVNDANDCYEAIENCLLCSVAGFLGQTASAVLQDVTNAVGPIDEAGMAFVKYYERRTRTAANLGKTLERQIAGASMYLNVKNFKTTTHGSAAAPLSLAAAQHAMLQYPDGIRFLYMICGVSGEMGVTAAHWVYAQKAGGTITWTDYQTDILPGTLHQRAVTKAGRVKVGGVLGQPNQQAAPMRAFGQAVDGSDRSVVVAIGRAVWQAAYPRL